MKTSNTIKDVMDRAEFGDSIVVLAGSQSTAETRRTLFERAGFKHITPLLSPDKKTAERLKVRPKWVYPAYLASGNQRLVDTLELHGCGVNPITGEVLMRRSSRSWLRGWNR